MQTLDLVILTAFLGATLLTGILQGKSNRTSNDFFLGGRALPWPVAMLSIVATETSVLTFVSIPGVAYRGDWTFLQLAAGYIIGRLLVSTLLLPAYFRQGVTSIYEVLGRKFGIGIQKLASATFLTTRILADGVRFLATAVVVEAVTGWPTSLSVIVIGVVTLTYTLSGGIRTVVWLDSMQFMLYLFGGLVTIAFILDHLGLSLFGALQTLHDAGKLTIINTDSHILTNPWAFWGAVTGGALLSLASHGIDYMMVQRALVCESLSSARKAMIGSGMFVFMQFTVFLLAGSLIYLYAEGAPMQKDREFAYFIVNELPVGLRGILLAGVLSAAMSTLSSSINALASSTVTDFMGGNASIKTSRFISLAWAAILIGIALLFDENDTAIIILGLQIASFTYGGLLGLFLLARSSMRPAPASLATGLLASMAVVIVLMQMTNLAWTWYILCSTITNILVTSATELIQKQRHERK